MASPTPEREADDEYSLHQCVDALARSQVTLIHGDSDDEVAAGEVEWLATQFPAKPTVHTLESGHQLPAAWVDLAVEALTAR